MKKNYVILLGLVFQCLLVSASALPGKVYNIVKYGAKGNGKTINTNAINQAVTHCNEAGGGTVLIPKGIYVTGTINLKSNIRLHLEEGAVIQGTVDVNEYKPYKPIGSLSKYDSGGDGPNANSALNKRWNSALILGIGINNVSIEGQGIIDGNHVFDALGEEKMRGPHTILIGESRNISVSGVTLNRASNYAFMAYEIENVTFHNIEINEGWDGIHIRGGKNVVIRNCKFYTGDDAIAGGYWENMVISDCLINSSCNGIRMIMPADGLTIAHCKFQGPGKYAHRTSKEKKRSNMLSAILLQPGGWGRATGDMQRVYIHDIDIQNLSNPLMFILNEGNDAGDIVVERIKATNVHQTAASIESWKGGTFGRVVLRDMEINYVGNPNQTLKDIQISQPGADARPLPCWGLYVRNVKQMVFENVKLSYDGQENRPVLWFDNVGKIELNNVSYPETDGGKSIIVKDTGVIVKDKAR